MRQHLFRGIRVDNQEWVEGYYVKAEKLNGDGYEHFIIEEPADGRSHLVVPETVSEYIGIDDQYGNKIWENSIIRTQEYSDRPYSKNRKFKQHIGVVKYITRHFKNKYHECDYEAKWIVDIKDYEGYHCYDWSEFFLCEVIGNVFENSELLEG